MPIGTTGDYIGLLPFFSFAISVIAAVVAIDMFRLLRTGQTGKSWRVLSIAAVIYALMQALRMAEFLHWKTFSTAGLSQIAELMFVLALAYSFYLQRKLFSEMSARRGEFERRRESDAAIEEPGDAQEPDALETDWSQFGGLYQPQGSDEAAGSAPANAAAASAAAPPRGDDTSLPPSSERERQ
jgi:hypothetical protein